LLLLLLSTLWLQGEVEAQVIGAEEEVVEA
jgi:hypothetical protein